MYVYVCICYMCKIIFFKNEILKICCTENIVVTWYVCENFSILYILTSTCKYIIHMQRSLWSILAYLS